MTDPLKEEDLNEMKEDPTTSFVARWFFLPAGVLIVLSVFILVLSVLWRLIRWVWMEV